MNRLLKIIFFYLICFLGIKYITYHTVDPALNQLYSEAVFCFIVLIISLVFIRFEKKKWKLINTEKIQKHILYGIKISCIWITPAFILLYLSATIVYNRFLWNAMLPIWLIACLLNVIGQELLVRGYAFQFMKNKNPFSAILISTLIFVVLCGHMNPIALINLAMMSIFLSLICLNEKSLIPVITIRFLWNGMAGILFNGIPLKGAYPQIIQLTFQGNPLLSGGSLHMEASIVITLLNMLLISHFLLVKKTKLH